MILIIGYVLSFFTGIVINLLGGGGSIMTVPILVYLFSVDPYLATSYSMFLVGLSSWLATIDNAKKKMIIYKLAFVFALPDLIVTYLIRKFLLPILPNVIFTYDNITLTKQSSIMLIFASLMMVASVNSLRSKKEPSTIRPTEFNYPLIIIQGMLVGLVTGLVGAGGGFLIIPAFVIASKVPMNIAIYTSSLVIAISTTIGFIGDFNPQIDINWKFLLIYTAITISGVFAINPFKKKIGNHALRKTFGYLIFILSLVIFYIEFSKLGNNL